MVAVALVCLAMMNTQQWKPVQGGLMTRWAKDVRADAPHSEYPRPSLVRTEWKSLNGLWDYAIAPSTTKAMPQSDGKILVPFPVESALSGVKKPLTPDETLWYRRTFEVPKGWGKHVLLHFDAVDWRAEVWLNGQRLGSHQGGYDQFTFDVSTALHEGENELLVAVQDPTDTGTQPRGKQVLHPEGIWYTAVSGIWQDVWMEPVGDAYIKGLTADGDPSTGRVKLQVDADSFAPSDTLVVSSL
ncbi:MAG TPA: beta galactosidase jelly roll domain-containing protein, partial [Fimbriimonadaceae bacterium]|nr:beta galactosidase jelly roll domain-containing protein [Fimbriimonadaceae bacterium]